MTVFTPADLKACWMEGEEMFLKFLAKLVLHADKKTRSTPLRFICEISLYVNKPSFSLSFVRIIEEFLKLL